MVDSGTANALGT